MKRRRGIRLMIGFMAVLWMGCSVHAGVVYSNDFNGAEFAAPGVSTLYEKAAEIGGQLVPVSTLVELFGGQATQDVLRDDPILTLVDQERRIHLAQRELKRIVVHRFDLFRRQDVGKAGAARRVDVCIEDRVIGELDVVCSERLAVVPNYVLAEVERKREIVIRHIPTLGQVREHTEIGYIDVDQAVVQQGSDIF